jgi:hypothetical protein
VAHRTSPVRRAAPEGGTTIDIAKADDFDPLGDGVEHPELLNFATDGNPTGTSWQTETYTAGPSLLDSGKSGVGIYVDTRSPQRAMQMVVRSPTPGWSGEVYAAASGPPSTLAGWGELVGAVKDASSNQAISLSLHAPERYYLLWITTLAQVSDGYRVEVSDIRLEG